MTTKSGEKLNDALTMANEAVKEMGGNVKGVITEDYNELKDALGRTKIGRRLVESKDNGLEKMKEFGASVDDSVHAKPYHYIAGAAVTGLLLGVLLGRK